MLACSWARLGPGKLPVGPGGGAGTGAGPLVLGLGPRGADCGAQVGALVLVLAHWCVGLCPEEGPGAGIGLPLALTD